MTQENVTDQDVPTTEELETTSATIDKLTVDLPIIQIDVNEIRVIPNALRTHDITNIDIIELAASIKKYGLLNKFCVVKRYNQELDKDIYYIADGARRWNALLSLDKAQLLEDSLISVSLLPEEVTDTELLALQIRGNANIKSTANSNYVNALYLIMVENTFTTKELGDYVGVNEAWIKKILKTMNLPVEAKEKLDNGDLKSVTSAIEFGKAVKNGLDDSFFEQVLELACSESVEGFRQGLKEFEDASLALKKQRESLEPDATVDFVPKPKFAGKGVAEALYFKLAEEFETVEKPSPKLKNQMAVVNLLFEMDEDTLLEKKAAFETKIKSAEDKKNNSDNRKVVKNSAWLNDHKLKVIGEDGQEINPADFPFTEPKKKVTAEA